VGGGADRECWCVEAAVEGSGHGYCALLWLLVATR
jgi:hypothetical protein